MSGPVAVVVDNDENSRILTHVLMRQAGYDVVECDSGEDGLQALAALRPAIVLFDFRLGDMDGIRFLERARTIPGYLGVPLVSVTGSVMPEQKQSILAAGAAAVVAKPIDTRTFASTVELAARVQAIAS